MTITARNIIITVYHLHHHTIIISIYYGTNQRQLSSGSQDRAGWKEVVCDLRSMGSEKVYTKSSEVQIDR